MGIRNFSNNIKRVMLKIKIARAELQHLLHIFASLLRQKMLRSLTTKFESMIILINTMLYLLVRLYYFSNDYALKPVDKYLYYPLAMNW